MPSPSDTTVLLHDLQATAEAVRDIQRKAREVLQRVTENNAADIADRLANAAIAAGMPPARAFSYAEEYSATLGNAQGTMEAIVGRFGDLKIELDTLIHIANVLPYRCPNPTGSGGRPTLVLKN
jgi:hypothetical protein